MARDVPEMRRITIWSLVGSLWTVFCLSAAIYVTIPDAPWNYPFWEGLMTDPTAYYHEMFVILGTYLAGLLLLMVYSFWYHLCLFLETVKRFP